MNYNLIFMSMVSSFYIIVRVVIKIWDLIDFWYVCLQNCVENGIGLNKAKFIPENVTISLI